MKKISIIILMTLLSLGVNAQRSINYDLNLKGHELHNAVINSFASKAALDAHTVVGNGMLATVDGEPNNIYKYDNGGWYLVSGGEDNVNADWNATTGDAEILNKPINKNSNAVNATVPVGLFLGSQNSIQILDQNGVDKWEIIINNGVIQLQKIN